MNPFLAFDLGTSGLALLVGLFLVRQVLVTLAAEQGRKQDLVKKLYKANTDFHLSVLIPHLDSRSLPQLTALLKAIEEQEYPAAKVSVHIVAAAHSADDLGALRPNVKRWVHPEERPTEGAALAWLIERRLAAGGSGIFVFLKPGDMIKPDYFQNIVARGFESFVMQGYIAQKQRPVTPLEKVRGLSSRIGNRIHQAGRYHLGVSCNVMHTGWAIKQEVLEMIPFPPSLDNLEYTLRLTLENFRVTWAPNMVVYRREEGDFLRAVTDGMATFLNRLQLLLCYGFRLFRQGVAGFDLAALEQLSFLLTPPSWAVTTVLATLTALVYGDWLPGSVTTWAVLTATAIFVQILELFVARCRALDYVTCFTWTPILALAGLFTTPLAGLAYVFAFVQRQARHQGNARYAQAAHTRFNEALAPVEAPTPQERAFDLADHTLVKAIREQQQPLPGPTPTAESPVEEARPPRQQVKAVTLRNGEREVNCLLKTETAYTAAGEETYQMTLQYKTVGFSTAPYRILDQAFYELHTKLLERGFTLQTCGSCGYFYNPTADAPGAVKNAGVCLFGKQGKDVNLSTDAVTVTSQACDYHCHLGLREQIVRAWRDSLYGSLSG